METAPKIQLESYNSPPWTPKDVIWGMIAAVLWIASLGLLGLVIQYLGVNIDPSAILILGTLLLLVPVWYFTIYKYKANWSDLGLRQFTLRDLIIGCGLMALAFLFNIGYATFLANFKLQIQPDFAPMFEATGFPLLLLFGGAVVAPVVEEIFFRGFVFAGLKKQWSWQTAAASSAILFALVHLIPTSFPPIFILGFIFAFLYQISGSIWPAILMHTLTNTLALFSAYAIFQSGL